MGRSLIGTGLVVLGLVILGDQLGLWNGSSILRDWWPAALLVVGLAQLVQPPRPWIGAGIIVAVGVALLLSRHDVFRDDAWELVVPTGFVIVGCWLIFTHLAGGRVRAGAEDRANLLTVLGEAKSASRGTEFVGGSVTALLGKANLDLRQATPAPGGAQFATSDILGCTEIVVPRGWDIQVSGVPIFGGIDDKTRDDGPAPPGAPRLAVKALALFGAVEVKHAD